MWIVCQADDSHVMSSIIFSERYEKACFENVVCQSSMALEELNQAVLKVHPFYLPFFFFSFSFFLDFGFYGPFKIISHILGQPGHLH